MTPPTPDVAHRLERDALALADALADPADPADPAGLRRSASALVTAVAAAHPATPDGALAAEHAELAGSAAAALAAVEAWAGTPDGDPARAARRRAAAAAGRTLHADLRVHHAHERDARPAGDQVSPQ
jgi:hypothetical protein